VTGDPGGAHEVPSSKKRRAWMSCAQLSWAREPLPLLAQRKHLPLLPVEQRSQCWSMVHRAAVMPQPVLMPRLRWAADRGSYRSCGAFYRFHDSHCCESDSASVGVPRDAIGSHRVLRGRGFLGCVATFRSLVGCTRESDYQEAIILVC
jgi:hypothetical protein